MNETLLPWQLLAEHSKCCVLDRFPVILMKIGRKMTENIELHTYCDSHLKESDIEEYHEVNQGDFVDTTFTNKHSVKPVKEYDFFTQYDVKTTKKDVGKKKKMKKKEKQPNLMDIISSELAAVTVPIVENAISKSSFTAEQQSSYLEKSRSSLSVLQRRSFHRDFEDGWDNLETVNLNPIFPRVLENHAVTDHLNIPVQYVAPSNFNDLILQMDNADKNKAKFLDIEIKNMRFKHHHQFSLEKLLCNKLDELYNEYKIIERCLKDTLRDIKVNRETKNNLRQEILKISPNKKDDIRFDKTVRKYTEALLQLKEKYVETLQKEKDITHKIVSLWCDIETVREKKRCIETHYVLDVTKKRLSEKEFEKEWNEVFNEEFSDLLDKLEYEYVTKYLEYKEEKYTQNLDDSAKRRIRKPKLEIDEEVLKEEVEVITNNIVTRDKIYIYLKQDENVMSEAGKLDEKPYKNEYYFEIYVDNIFVCESDHFMPKHDKIADIEFVESFSVQILSNNTILILLLKENGKEVAELKLDLANLKKSNTKNSQFIAQNLVYNLIVEPNAKNVGCGYNIKEIASKNEVRLKSSSLFKGNLYTNCEIRLKIGWNNKLGQNKDEEVKSLMEVGRQLKRLIQGIDKPNMDLLIDIINKLYDRDVSNDENVINILRNICKTEIYEDETFSIDENSPEYIRLKLLHLRNNGVLTNVENKLIPIHASQISTELLNCLQNNHNDFDVQYFSDKYVDMDPIELQRFISAQYVRKLNKNMLKNLNEYLLRKTNKDVVRDFKDLSLRSLFTNQSTLATLATISNGAKQQLLNEGLSKEQEIRITVHRAFNLCDRSAAILDSDEYDDQIAGFKVRPLRPFVRLSYHGISVQTATAIGCHPTWNQTLKICTRLDPLSSIQINVYDENKVNISDTSDEERKTVHYRFYNKWIGTMQVPLYDVLSLGSLRGTNKISTPPIIFGYENPSQPKDSAQSLIPEVNQLMKKDSSFLSFHITSSLSHLGGLNGYGQPMPNSDDDYLVNHLNNFVSEYRNDFPARNISLAFIDSSGRNKCVTQFLQPILLPDIEWFPKNPKIGTESALSKSSGKSSSSKSSGRRKEESGEEKESIYSTVSWRNGESQLSKLMNACVRYVSLIPTYDVIETHSVTLMGVELLKVLYGSPLEHTILLASFFLQLGVRCWLAASSLRRYTAYLLTRYDLTTRSVVLLNDEMRSRGFLNRNDGYIWHVYDAVSGERTELRDVACPLKTVDFVFDNDNIWVNVQSSQDCESMSFDFTRTSDWQLVFDKTVFVMKLPLASEVGLYSPSADVERLRQMLETKIKEKVQKWRSHMKTIWNRYCNSLLKEALPHWEYWTFNPSEPKPLLSQRLKQLMVSYKMFGFPLNLPYVNTKSLISAVKATAVHVCDDPNVEFGLAVEMYAYPNNVTSVWVFLTPFIARSEFFRPRQWFL